jgi:hypothetical protein
VVKIGDGIVAVGFSFGEGSGFIKVVPWRPFLSAENGVVVLLVVIGKLGYLFFRF